MQYSLTQLVQFAAVVEQRSFSAAASHLHVAQPWLSTRVRQLEETVGFRLLDRSPRGVALTIQGEQFYQGVTRLLREKAALDEIINMIGAGTGRALRIGAIAESFYIGERNRLMDGFHEAFPALPTSLENHTDPELRRRILSGELDIAFINGRPPEQIDAVRIREGRCELLMSDDHRLAQRQCITLDDVRGERIGVFPRERNPAAWDESAGRLQAAGAILVILPEAIRDALVQKARRDHIMVLVLSSFGDQDSAHNGLCLRPIDQPDVHSDFFLVRRSAGPCDEHLERFWRFAQTFRLR